MRGRPTNPISQEDELAAASLVQRALEGIRPYDGPWTAYWLRGDAIGPNSWSLITRKSRLVNGEYIGDEIINWNLHLPDNTHLCDPENQIMLEASQKIAFLVRTSPSYGITTTSTHNTWITNLHFIVRWVFLNSEIYQPKQYAFSLLDEAGITEMMSELMDGGAIGALHYPQLILGELYRLALDGQTPPQQATKDPYHLPADDVKRISEWMTEGGFYDVTFIRKTEFIAVNRARLCALANLDVKQTATPKFSAFVRQFEPSILAMNGKLLLSVNGPRTEYPSHRTGLIEEICNNKCSAGKTTQVLSTIQTIFSLRKHLPTVCPPSYGVSFGRLRKMVEDGSAPVEGTPFVPIEIDLAYTTCSITWLVKYAEPLVTFYLRAVRCFYEKGKLNSHPQDPSKSDKKLWRDRWIRENRPESLQSLNISGWGTVFHHDQEDVHRQLREGPALHDAMDILLGAVISAVISSNCLREEEVVALKDSDLMLLRKDGYWIRHAQEKINLNDELALQRRPCPNLIASALLQMSRLKSGLLEIHKEIDSYALECLFYIPDSAHNATLRPRPLNRALVMRCLETFCDFANLPPDELGRRWYLRPHELRKSFLVNFFSSGGFMVLDACRWMAGHTNLNSIFSYLKKNTPKNRFLEIEAQIASAELWNVEQHREANIKNAENLYKDVCSRFGVKSISAIPHENLKHWLKSAFEDGIYSVSIRTYDDSIREDVAFIIGGDREKKH
jgi:hypothetical protein